MKLSSHLMKLHPSLSFAMSAKLMIFNAMKLSIKLLWILAVVVQAVVGTLTNVTVYKQNFGKKIIKASQNYVAVTKMSCC